MEESGTDIPAEKKEIIIFVVEDESQMRFLAVQQLASLGYQTIEAADGQQAVKMIESGAKFDFLFSDVIMPGEFSGFDVARRARARYPDMPILLTSGFSGTVEEIQKIMPSVRVELINKPYRKPDLAAKISEILEKKARRS